MRKPQSEHSWSVKWSPWWVEFEISMLEIPVFLKKGKFIIVHQLWSLKIILEFDRSPQIHTVFHLALHSKSNKCSKRCRIKVCGWKFLRIFRVFLVLFIKLSIGCKLFEFPESECYFSFCSPVYKVAELLSFVVSTQLGCRVWSQFTVCFVFVFYFFMEIEQMPSRCQMSVRKECHTCMLLATHTNDP